MKWIVADRDFYLAGEALVLRYNKGYYVITKNIYSGDKYIPMCEFKNLPSVTTPVCIYAVTLESCF